MKKFVFLSFLTIILTINVSAQIKIMFVSAGSASDGNTKNTPQFMINAFIEQFSQDNQFIILFATHEINPYLTWNSNADNMSKGENYTVFVTYEGRYSKGVVSAVVTDAQTSEVIMVYRTPMRKRKIIMRFANKYAVEFYERFINTIAVNEEE